MAGALAFVPVSQGTSEPDSYEACQSAYVGDVVACETETCYATAFNKLVRCQKVVLITHDPAHRPREMHVDGDIQKAMVEEERTRIRAQIRNKNKEGSQGVASAF